MTWRKACALIVLPLGILCLFGFVLFKILHWPGQDFLIILAPLFIVVGIGLILWDNKVQ